MAQRHKQRSVTRILETRNVLGTLSSTHIDYLRNLYDAPLVIKTNDDFYRLIDEHTIIDRTCVEFVGLGDIKPNDFPIFPKCKTLKLTRCDKNFAHYWLSSRIFPELETIILWSHPGHRMVYYSFSPTIRWIVHPEFITYADAPGRIIVKDTNAPPLYK